MRACRVIPLLLLFMACLLPQAFAGLREYVNSDDPSFRFDVVNTSESESSSVFIVRMTSQTWRGIPWQHWLTVFRAKNATHPEAALLFVYGGNNGDNAPDGTDEADRIVRQIAEKTGSTAAVLRQVPNQPLFDGLHEDALISFTFEQYMGGGGEEWPLLFPMVKSAVRAMDVIQAITGNAAGRPVEQFMVTGGSKRGWTTWLTAVTDRRVARIAPLIIDTLNMPVQMQHQLAVYGGFTESIGDYTQRGIQNRMLAGEGSALLKEVDPFSWRAELSLPKLVVLGTNDPYWTVDAANFYFHDLAGDKWLYYQANTAHDASLNGVATITQFYGSMLTGKPFPKVEWQRDEQGTLQVSWDQPGGEALLWTAASPNRDFRGAAWSNAVIGTTGKAVATVPAPAEGWLAYYVEVRWPGEFGVPFGITTTMTVIPDVLPPAGIRAYD